MTDIAVKPPLAALEAVVSPAVVSQEGDDTVDYKR